MSEVILTIDTPVYNITDQAGFVDLVREAVFTVTEDNAFMTLIDYDNIELVLPVADKNFKASPQLCCHSCPEGHAYRLGHCGTFYIILNLNYTVTKWVSHFTGAKRIEKLCQK